jgi:transcriptional regulator with PAS, ATPase and Fis domain
MRRPVDTIHKSSNGHEKSIRQYHDPPSTADARLIDSGLIDKLLAASYDGLIIFDAHGTVVRSGGLLLDKMDQLSRNQLQEICHGVICSGRRANYLLPGGDEGRVFLLTASPAFEGKRVSHVVCNVRGIEDLKFLEQEAGYAELRQKKDHPSIFEHGEYQKELKDFITRSAAMQSVLASAARVAQVDSTILIAGESGVGKGMLARIIHRVSKRKDRPFVKISCGAIPEQLLESELFGYESGAFTGARREGKPGLFELAADGTVFLDEVAELPLSLQVKLLNVLQDRVFMRVGGIKEIAARARVIAATNKDLKHEVERGTFRADLFYRLHVIPITIPPLRARRGDVLPLISHFLVLYNDRYGFKRSISPEALDYLMKYEWPGNVRELQNVMEFLIVMAQDDEIKPGDLPDKLVAAVQGTGSSKQPADRITLKDAVEEYESCLISRVLAEHETLKEAAERLGIDISTLTRKKKKYGMIKNELVNYEADELAAAFDKSPVRTRR